MPEPNKRVVVEGTPLAERQYSELIAERLQAEGGVKGLNKELEALRRQAAELRRLSERDQ